MSEIKATIYNQIIRFDKEFSLVLKDYQYVNFGLQDNQLILQATNEYSPLKLRWSVDNTCYITHIKSLKDWLRANHFFSKDTLSYNVKFNSENKYYILTLEDIIISCSVKLYSQNTRDRFTENVISTRKKYNLSIHEFADMCKVTSAVMYNLERRGLYKVSYGIIGKIALGMLELEAQHGNTTDIQ